MGARRQAARPLGLLPRLAAGAALGPVAVAPAIAATRADLPSFATTAPIAYMVDLGSGRELLAREQHRRFPPASLAKIMTAYVAFELLAAGRLRPSQRFTVSDAAHRQWAGVGSTMYLAGGSLVTVDALLMGLMTVSANDAAIVFAEGAAGSVDRFVALMNAHARRLGLNDSRFGTPNGWPDGGATQTSAADLVILTRAMIERHPGLFRRYIGRPTMAWNGISQSSRNPLLGKVAGADGVKTGYTQESGYGIVGSAARSGRRLIMVLAGFPSAGSRADEAPRFLEWGFTAWRAQRVVARNRVIVEARVQQGASRTVPLLAPEAYFVTFAPGEPAHYRLRVRYRGPLRAPLRKGQPGGVLVVSAAGQSARELPLVVARDVAAAGFWQRMRNGLLGLAGV